MESLNNSVLKTKKSKAEEFSLEDLYNNLENLSIGDFGFVKTGERKDSGRKETIKVIVKRKFDPLVIERKMKSLDLLSKHSGDGAGQQLPPEVGRIYWVKDTDKKIYIGSEFVQGIELQKLVLTRGPLSSLQVQHVISSLARVILGYQSIGLVYTDLRAEKIIVPVDPAALPDVKVPIKIIDNGNSLVSEKGFVPEAEFKKCYPKVIELV